ncbi:putative thiol methyltransferase 2 [Sesamum angolense]|uniref:Thiol methyltransferase 2 n=1 Tax=Sesamum angolense TaxID=2727404 RepID=A0AAE1X1Y2_9LAMI|nr:putative thiol methyltransferase 2 [Sesamum angolense]
MYLTWIAKDERIAELVCVRCFTSCEVGNASQVLVQGIVRLKLVVSVLKKEIISCIMGRIREKHVPHKGYDVVAIASAERHVVGVDLSDNAIKEPQKQLSSQSPNAEHFTFLKTDFFTWCPTQLFDLIFDYTFFCAIEPGLRSQWARKIRDLLKPDGELITLMFPVDDHEGGPPYKVSVADYEEVLHPLGLQATYIAENELAVAPRMPAGTRETREMEKIRVPSLAMITSAAVDDNRGNLLILNL